MTGIVAICALHASSVLQEVATERATHDVVEGLHGELVAVLFHNIFLLLPHSTLAIEADVERSSVFYLLGEAEGELDSPDRLQREPGINEDRSSLRAQTGSRRTSSCCGRTSRTTLRTLRVGRWLELQVGSRLSIGHLIRGRPSSLVELGFDPLSSNLIYEVRQPDPQQANGYGMIA